MTEAEWLASATPLFMLDHAAAASDRKVRLFGVACCRRAAAIRPHPKVECGLHAAEELADGRVSNRQRLMAWRGSRPTAEEATEGTPFTPPWLLQKRALLGVKLAVAGLSRFVAEAGGATSVHAEHVAQAALLRDIFGNPFRPVTFSPSWRTDTVTALAAQMYESRDFGAMPILADALQDAGCDSDDILNHCRNADQPHVRGCWVVDLVLGKE